MFHLLVALLRVGVGVLVVFVVFDGVGAFDLALVEATEVSEGAFSILEIGTCFGERIGAGIGKFHFVLGLIHVRDSLPDGARVISLAGARKFRSGEIVVCLGGFASIAARFGDEEVAVGQIELAIGNGADRMSCFGFLVMVASLGDGLGFTLELCGIGASG